MKQLPLFLLNAAAAAALCACSALDPIPLTELPRDAGAVLEDATVEDTGVDTALPDAGFDADVDMGTPVETAIDRWFAEACAFARRCEAKEPSSRMFQSACLAPPGVGLEQLLPPSVYAQLQNSRIDEELPEVLDAYLTAAVAQCDVGPFLEPDRIFVGRAPDGELCNFDYNCESQHCSTADTSCDARRCLPRRVTGDACTRDGTCPMGDYCVAGVCAALPGPGELCPTGRCSAGAACNGSICVARGAVGSLCTRTANGGDTCGSELVCTHNANAGTFQCTPGRAAGETCDSTHRPCANGLRCDGGACIAAGVTDATCTGDHQCVDGFSCTGGRCTPRPLLGEACSLAPCMIGTCRSGTCQHSTAGFTCSRTSLLDPVPGCKDAYCEGGLCHTYLELGDACEYFEDTCGPMGACGANQCQARGTIGTPCGAEPLPPCLTGLTCVGPSGAQTCQACE